MHEGCGTQTTPTESKSSHNEEIVLDFINKEFNRLVIKKQRQ
jgi:hypothetical protein